MTEKVNWTFFLSSECTELYSEDEEASDPVGRFQIYQTAEDTLLL